MTDTKIPIQGSLKRLVERLQSQEGCFLNWANYQNQKKTPSLSRDQESSDDTDSGSSSDNDTNLTKEERLRREYISIKLNANRDPQSAYDHQGRVDAFHTKRLVESDANFGDFATVGDFDQEWQKIHRRYESLSDYEKLYTDSTSGFVDIAQNKVFKRKLCSGTGQPIKCDSLVFFNYAFWSEASREPFDSTWLRRKIDITDMAQDPILPGLRELLLTARQGEFCEAIFLPEFAFGKLGAPPRIPADAKIFCVLEVVKCADMKEMDVITRDIHSETNTRNFEELYETADKARKSGNLYCSTKQYATANQRYRSGIILLEGLSYKDEAEERKGTELLIKLYNNRARTANASGKPRIALQCCKEAKLLHKGRPDPKTFYHEMTAWSKKGDLDKAVEMAKTAIKLFNQDESITAMYQRQLEILQKQVEIDRKATTELYKLMGSRFAKTRA